MGAEVWYLHSATLLDWLEQVRQAETLADLRARVAELSALLEQPDSPLHAAVGDDDMLELRRAYLRGELDQMSAAQGLDRARYYTSRLLRAITEQRTSGINDLNLHRWKEYEDIYTDSLWVLERRDKSGVHRASYWGNFIPQIPYQMMRRYTRRGEWVLDPFAGLGTTLIEGQRLGRNVLGIELQEATAAEARRLVAAEPNPQQVTSAVVTADSASVDYAALLAEYGQQAVQLVLLHPPYWDIISFSDDPRDLSNAASVSDFLAQMSHIVQQVLPVLERGRYLALVIGDKYARGEWIPLGFRTMDALLGCDLSLKSIVVKNFEHTTGKRQQKELWRYRALVGGFYIFKHEYIFILQKP
jgi:hypothetical protein